MSTTRKEHPGQWDERFSVPEYVYGESPNDFIREIASSHLNEPMEVVCLCEGEGRNAVWLAELGHQVTNIDLSGVALEKCKALAAKRGVEVHTIQSDMADFHAEPRAQISSYWCLHIRRRTSVRTCWHRSRKRCAPVVVCCSSATHRIKWAGAPAAHRWQK
jgi:hypothetical protein